VNQKVPLKEEESAPEKKNEEFNDIIVIELKLKLNSVV
jgi:hypothetical protein